MRPSLEDRRFLSALIFFERAARRLSFSEAAAELSVTTSAVSHQIRRLEEALQVRLFERKARAVALTAEGAQLFASAQGAFAELGEAVSALTRSETIRVSIGPFLSSHWLMPRLGAFERSEPTVRVDLVHAVGPPDLAASHVAIVWGDEAWHRRGGERLFGAETVPVGAASERGTGGPGMPFWEGGLPPLHYRDRRAWKAWCEAAGAPHRYAEQGEIYEDPNLVLEAAAHARGVALGFLPFVAAELSRGRLQVLHPTRAKSPDSYWLLAGRRRSPAATGFMTWLSREAERDAE